MSIRGAGDRGIMRRKLGGPVALALTFAALTSQAGAVNATLTPGATNPAVTQANVGSTICRRGYTKTVRNVSTLVKHAVYAEYGIPRSAQRNYVIDHLIPLEVGGGNDPKNLWPEAKAEAKVKDKLRSADARRGLQRERDAGGGAGELPDRRRSWTAGHSGPYDRATHDRTISARLTAGGASRSVLRCRADRGHGPRDADGVRTGVGRPESLACRLTVGAGVRATRSCGFRRVAISQVLDEGERGTEFGPAGLLVTRAVRGEL